MGEEGEILNRIAEGERAGKGSVPGHRRTATAGEEEVQQDEEDEEEVATMLHSLLDAARIGFPRSY